MNQKKFSTRESLAEQLQPFAQTGFFITFTDLPKVGINPNNQFKTPLGVYCYPVEDVIEEIDDGNFMFGLDRKYFHVLKQKNKRVLDLSNYSADAFEKDFDILNEYVKKKGKHIAPLIAKVNESNLYAVKNVGSLFWNLSQAVAQTEGAKVGKLKTERSTIVWNKLLRDMGYDLVVDRSSNVHLLQSSQAIFLAPTAYQVVHSTSMPKKIDKVVDSYWGSATQPFWHPGPNPTVDVVMLRNGAKEKEILLVRRAARARAEPGKWALPGGFVDTNAKRGQAWAPDRENLLQAAVRETAEETGVYISSLGAEFQLVGVFEGGGRDPRDNKEAWVRSTAVAIDLKDRKMKDPKGRDDADRAEWIALSDLEKTALAFDHDKIIKNGLRILGVE